MTAASTRGRVEGVRVGPGLEPFAPSLLLPAWLCANCGFWQRGASAPGSCPLCADARHVLPPDGDHRFRGLHDALAAHPVTWTDVAGVTVFTWDPAPGIGPLVYLVDDVVFEGGGPWSGAALDVLRAAGVRAVAASHPHTYGALWQLQDALGPDVELCLHPGDLAWTSALRVTWPWDDVLDLGGGLALHHLGGHFAGQAALHDARRGILFCGDAFKLDLDPADHRRAVAISTHKAFVRAIPMTHAELRGYRAVVERLSFAELWTPFEQGANVDRDVVLALLDRQLAGRPTAEPVAVEELTG